MTSSDTGKELKSLKRFVKHKLETDPNARSFLNNGTIMMEGKVWHQYYFLEPPVTIKHEDLTNRIALACAGIDEIRTNREESGIRIRVNFTNGRKPRMFERCLRRLDGKYGTLLTYKDCQVTPEDLK